MDAWIRPALLCATLLSVSAAPDPKTEAPTAAEAAPAAVPVAAEADLADARTAGFDGTFRSSDDEAAAEVRSEGADRRPGRAGPVPHEELPLLRQRFSPRPRGVHGGGASAGSAGDQVAGQDAPGLAGAVPDHRNGLLPGQGRRRGDDLRLPYRPSKRALGTGRRRLPHADRRQPRTLARFGRAARGESHNLRLALPPPAAPLGRRGRRDPHGVQERKGPPEEHPAAAVEIASLPALEPHHPDRIPRRPPQSRPRRRGEGDAGVRPRIFARGFPRAEGRESGVSESVGRRLPANPRRRTRGDRLGIPARTVGRGFAEALRPQRRRVGKGMARLGDGRLYAAEFAGGRAPRGQRPRRRPATDRRRSAERRGGGDPGPKPRRRSLGAAPSRRLRRRVRPPGVASPPPASPPARRASAVRSPTPGPRRRPPSRTSRARPDPRLDRRRSTPSCRITSWSVRTAEQTPAGRTGEGSNGRSAN